MEGTGKTSVTTTQKQKKDSQLVFSISSEMKNKAKELADAEGITLSKLVIKAIENYLDFCQQKEGLTIHLGKETTIHLL